MGKIKLDFIYFFSLVVFLNLDVNAGTVMGNGGSTEVTQMANNAVLGEQLRQMIEQVNNLQKQLQIQDQILTDTKRQGKALDNYQWGNIERDFDQLTRIVRMGQGISYTMASVDVEYRNKYKGFDEYKQKKEPYKKRYDAQDRILRELQTMSQSSEGRHQALQVGHQIAVQEVHQLQKLRAIQLSQMQMQAAYQAQENSEKSYYRANRSEYFGSRSTEKIILGNGKKY
jgi:conjugal transfer/entry exclusion protein